jgi:Tfp pilus assembly protein FimT
MKSKAKGITLIEILLVLGLLAILMSFAVPSVSGAVSKAEMKSTLENIQYSLQVARRTARMTETEVSMHISPAEQETTQTITFSSPGKGGTSNHLQIQDFTLPAEIVLISDHDAFRFDGRGLVEEPGRILLVSRVDESITSTIEIN